MYFLYLIYGQSKQGSEMSQLANETCTTESLAESFILLKSGNQIKTYLAVFHHQFDLPEGREYCCSEFNFYYQD